MFNWFRRKWDYLGWSEMYFNDQNGKKARSNTVHFSSRRGYRKVTYSAPLDSLWKNHAFYTQSVYPWLQGDNLYGPINHPSDYLKDLTWNEHGQKWDPKKRWYKPIIAAPNEDKDGLVSDLVADYKANAQ